MKKTKLEKPAVMLCLLLFCISFAGSVRASAAENAPQISAGAAVVADLDSGALLYEENSEASYAPADLTKIMTVLLLAENYDLSETVSFSEILYQTEEGGVRLGLQPGEEITLYAAACAIWLENADDVANGVAEYAAGSRSAFAELMNQRAQELGCQNTSFSDPNGYYTENQYTCASDLRLILQAAYQNAAFREISGLKEYEIPATNLTQSSRYLQTSYQALQTDSGSWQEYFAGGMESAASGGTEHLAVFCSSGGKNLIVIVLGATDAETAASDAALLAEYGFSNDTASGSEQGEAASETAAGTSEEVLVLTEAADDVQEGEANSPAQEESAAQTGQESQETQNTGNEVMDAIKNWLVPILANVNDALQDLLEYAGNHKMQTVVIVDGVLAVVLVLLLVISFIRGVRNARIRRRRKRERRQRRIREEQIERMRVEDLENELAREQKKEARESKNRRK